MQMQTTAGILNFANFRKCDFVEVKVKGHLIVFRFEGHKNVKRSNPYVMYKINDDVDIKIFLAHIFLYETKYCLLLFS